jgi:ATP adenylyltransferase
MSGSESFVNLNNARNDEQRGVMETIEQNNECPFCPDALHKYHQQPILRSGEHWLLTPNQWPYDNTRTHLLAIAAYHAETLADLQPGSFDELQTHFAWAEAEFKIAAGGLAMRFGDTARNGATVRHLHAHLIQPDPDRPEDAKVRFKIG